MNETHPMANKIATGKIPNIIRQRLTLTNSVRFVRQFIFLSVLDINLIWLNQQSTLIFFA